MQPFTTSRRFEHHGSQAPQKPNLSALVVRPLDPQEVRLKPAPVWSKALAWTIIGSASFGFVFACFAKIDEVVLAQGELQPLGADRPIKAPFAGVVKEILVKEGQKVRAGQPLLRLDAEVSKKRAETLQRQLGLETVRFNEESRSIQAREQSLRERMDGLTRAMRTERQIYNDIIPLGKLGAIQRMQLLQQKNRVEQLQSEIAQARANLQEVQAQLLKMKQESLRELADLDRQLVEVKDTQDKEVLKAPLTVWCSGWCPPALAMPLLRGNPGEGRARRCAGGQGVCHQSRCGLLKKGMVAQIRVDAFPYTQFGSIPGALKSVGTLPVQPDEQNPLPRFPAYIRLDRDYVTRDNNRFPVSAGQSVQANLVLRDKRVISLLTDAVQKTLDSLRSIRSDS